MVVSGGLGHVIPSNNKTQLIQCNNMLVIVDFGGNARSYLCAGSKARELKALHSQFGMLFGAMRLLPQTRQLFCYSKVAWVDTPRVYTPRLSSAPVIRFCQVPCRLKRRSRNYLLCHSTGFGSDGTSASTLSKQTNKRSPTIANRNSNRIVLVPHPTTLVTIKRRAHYT